jgi:hypothetical protein
MDIAELAERVHALESVRDDTMLASEHGARLIRLIEGFGDMIGALNTRVNFLERELAELQRQHGTTN